MIRFRIIIEEGFDHGFTETYHHCRIPQSGKAAELFETMLKAALKYVKDNVIIDEGKEDNDATQN